MKILNTGVRPRAAAPPPHIDSIVVCFMSLFLQRRPRKRAIAGAAAASGRPASFAGAGSHSPVAEGPCARMDVHSWIHAVCSRHTHAHTHTKTYIHIYCNFECKMVQWNEKNKKTFVINGQKFNSNFQWYPS